MVRCRVTGSRPREVSISSIAASKSAYALTKGDAFGIRSVSPEIEFSDVKKHISRVIKKIEPHDSVERFEKLGVKVIQNYGKFISKNEVLAGDQLIVARRFVIATGSEPLIPKIKGLDKVEYYTNKNIFVKKKKIIMNMKNMIIVMDCIIRKNRKVNIYL